MSGDGVDQITDVFGLMKGAVHWNVDVEFLFDSSQNHHDINRLQIKTLNRCVQSRLFAVEHPFLDDDVDDVVSKFGMIEGRHLHLLLPASNEEARRFCERDRKSSRPPVPHSAGSEL